MKGSLAAHRLWRSSAPGWVALRAALLPAAELFRMGVAVKNAAYDAGLLPARRLPLPAVGVGGLAVGGSGKTPLTGWLAAELSRRGLRPAIVLRGYGDDETAVHREAGAAVIVEAGRDRLAAASRAGARGATALVLDDCLQHRAVAPDLMLAAVSAETWRGNRLPLPAGPWREGAVALRRADAVVVTRKAAAASEAERLAAELGQLTRRRLGAVADLLPGGLRPLRGGPLQPLDRLRGREVLALCGIGEPEPFAAQLSATGALVELHALDDHHAYSGREIEMIAAQAGGRLVVTTAKDAAKLVGCWPEGGPECLVSVLEVQLASGAAAIGSLLDRVATAARITHNGAAASSPARSS